MTDKGAVRWCAVILFVACIAAASQAVAQRNDSLEELLQRAGNHVRGYQREIPAIVAQEDYTQRFIVEPSIQVRHLRSDFLTIRDDVEGWIGFRDVYEVDGRPVRDRTDRLTKLFLAPHPDSQSQARRIAEESARFNLGGQVLRTMGDRCCGLSPRRSLHFSSSAPKTRTAHGSKKPRRVG